MPEIEPRVPELDKRKAYILTTVVYEYIATAEPVGSATLTQKYNLGVSSATIRNEMAELEARGYLVQPHTSAGRVPSDVGYRTYVDRLMPPENLSDEEGARLHAEFAHAGRALDEIVEQTTRLLSQLSQNLAVVVAPSRDSQTFRHLQLIWLAERSILMVVVTTAGVTEQHVIEPDAAVDPDELTRCSNALNKWLSGRLLSELDRAAVVGALREIAPPVPLSLIDGVVAGFAKTRRPEERRILFGGAQHLLDQPEFRDFKKLRSILDLVEEQRTLYRMVLESIEREHAEPSVRIGGELDLEDMSECSLVTIPYRMGDRSLGVLAILGARRMPYGRMMALVAATAEHLSQHLTDVELP
ncbi:MAG TPA: heat-inducible transcriptional repressor HrcA [Candidatus Dormibacteraeota bacterium]|nr:heat-inducible transcriptional repressor HrcA [Candidatus Dormibacteraeota bacterium]